MTDQEILAVNKLDLNEVINDEDIPLFKK